MTKSYQVHQIVISQMIKKNMYDGIFQFHNPPPKPVLRHLSAKSPLSHLSPIAKVTKEAVLQILHSWVYPATFFLYQVTKNECLNNNKEKKAFKTKLCNRQ